MSHLGGGSLAHYGVFKYTIGGERVGTQDLLVCGQPFSAVGNARAPKEHSVGFLGRARLPKQ
jgi:hypothetical protein